MLLEELESQISRRDHELRRSSREVVEHAATILACSDVSYSPLPGGVVCRIEFGSVTKVPNIDRHSLSAPSLLRPSGASAGVAKQQEKGPVVAN